MKWLTARACVACLLFGAAAVAAMAEDADASRPRGSLVLEDAVELAIRRNPDLAASAYELDAARARVTQAGLRPNPELSAEFENFAGSGETQGTDSLETTLSLGQVIELGGKRRLRVGAAEAGLGLVDIEQRARQLDVLAAVTTRFVDVVAAQERLRLANESREIAQGTLDAISVRVTAGRTPEAERSRARIALLRADLDAKQLGGELRGARLALASLWADPEPAFTTAEAALFTLPEVVPLGELASRIERNPDIVRFASEARLRDAELELARAQARPDLALGLGVRQLSASDDTAIVAGFSIPLPFSNRNQGAIREAEVRRVQSDAQREATLIRVRAGLFALHQQMTTARERVTVLRGDALPQARAALDQTQAGYDRGRFSFLELAAAQQDLLAVQASAIDAAADYHRLLAEIERLTSEPLTLTELEAQVP